jgi:hypothetical protein
MSTYADTHAGDSSVRWVHLYQLSLPGAVVLRWTDDILPVYSVAGQPLAGAAVWTPYVVTVEAITTEQGQVAGATLTIGSADNVFGAYLFGSDVTGSVIQVWQAWMDPTNPGQVPLDVKPIFVGRIAQPGLVRPNVKLSLGPYADPSTKLLPARTVADLLRH